MIMNKSKATFEDRVEDWALRVIQARRIRREGDSVDTYQMIRDIDEIIAEGFHHDPVLGGVNDDNGQFDV